MRTKFHIYVFIIEYTMFNVLFESVYRLKGVNNVEDCEMVQKKRVNVI